MVLRKMRGALGAIAPPSNKNLPFLGEYENQNKLYAGVNDTPVLALFPKTLL